jgi:SAM-dependent methyltransferase
MITDTPSRDHMVKPGSLLRTLANHLPLPIRAAARRIWHPIHLEMQRRRYGFTYSRDFYECGYHDMLADIGGDGIEFWERQGYRERLMEVCDSLDCFVRFATPTRYLEVACMYGKTAFWLAERYPQLNVWAFDFSRRFVEATRRANPIGHRLTVWQGDATDIRLGADRFDTFFDFVTCLDVTEHLPDDVYRRMLAELARVTRAGGYLLIMQGNTVHVEHIHVLPESALIADVTKAGFEPVATLPERHHLFRRRFPPA